MCKRGRHPSGTNDGGSMGDAMRCDYCGVDKYPEVFPGTILKQRSLSDPEPGTFSSSEIRKIAQREINLENLKAAVEIEKKNLLTKRSLLQRLFPYKIKITRI